MNEFQHLRIKLAMESLITEREMMLAMNQERASQGYMQAFGEKEFGNLIDRLNSLSEELRSVGS